MEESEIDNFRAMVSETLMTFDFRIYDSLYNASQSKVPVLILGKTGTGKELMASIIHKHGLLSSKTFVPVNCAMIPKDLIYAELFGHEKGAYTGAMTARKGKFQEADNGTIFLDEIGDLSPDAQIGLLRVLENGEICPLGSSETLKVNARVIAATNRNLWSDKKFRKDLYYRLKVYPIRTTQLYDMWMLIPIFLKRFLLPLGIKEIDMHFLAFCMQNRWHGNVRELKNLCSFCAIKSKGNPVRFFEDNIAEFYDDQGSLPVKLRQFYDLHLPSSRYDNDNISDSIGGDIPIRINVSLKTYLDFLLKVFNNFDEPSMAEKVGLQISHSELGGKMYYFPLINLEDMKDFDGTFSWMSKGHFRSESTDSPVNNIITWILQETVAEHSVHLVMQDNANKAENLDLLNYYDAKESFDRAYFSKIFDRFSGRSDKAISKIIGLSDKTVKEKRNKYSS